MVVKNKLLKLSASAIKTYEQCHRKYWYQYIDKPEIERKSWPHLKIGNFVHEVLDIFHTILQKEDSHQWAELMTNTCKGQVKKFGLDKSEIETAKKMLSGYLTKLNKEGLPNVVAAEQKFEIIIDEDILLRGFIDRIDDEYSEGKNYQYHIQDYKGLDVDTPIPTPNGWAKMGELKVGDYVLGSDGKPTKVMVKSQTHHRPCYKLTLSDHSTVICDNVHKWNIGFRENASQGNWDKTLNADEIFELFSELKPLKTGSLIIKNSDALGLPNQKLPIDPWLLGAWLGDGTSKTGSFTVGKEDVVDMTNLLKRHWGTVLSNKEKNRNVYTITCTKPTPNSCSYGHPKGDAKWCQGCSKMNNNIRLGHLSKRPKKTNLPLRAYLRKNNLLNNKHIPQVYLRASKSQRLALLQGLMDTDGSWNPLRKRAVFVSAKKKLADSVLELLRTFGITVQKIKVTDKLGFTSYRLEFRPVGFNPFKLSRKASAVQASFPKGMGKSPYALRRTITNIEPIDSVPTECISVDSSDSLYLCGEGFVLTHNSGKSKYLDEFQLLVYGLHLLEQNPDLERFKGSYIMLAEESKNYMPSIFTKTDLEKVKDKIRKVAADIRSDQTWAPKPQFLCKYCDYNKICPASPHKTAANARREW